MAVHIEGSLGCGKGFLVKYMKNKFPFFNIVSMNDTLNVGNMLDLEQGKSRWSFFTCMDFLFKHSENAAIATTSNTLTFIESSIFSSRACYFQYLLTGGHFTPIERRLYEDWYTLLGNKNPRAIIYLQSNIQHQFERIIHNSKNEQTNISLEKLHVFNRLYEDYITLAQKSGIPVIRVQTPAFFEDNHGDMEGVLDYITESLRSLQILT